MYAFQTIFLEIRIILAGFCEKRKSKTILYRRNGTSQLLFHAARCKGLCCKKSQRNTMDVQLPFLLRLGRHSKQARDERHLACDVPFVYPLPFPHTILPFLFVILAVTFK